MTEKLKIYILAYPDNPISYTFLDVFINKNIDVRGIIVEEKKARKNKQRLVKKIKKDGLATAMRRTLQIYAMKFGRKTVVDLARKKNIDVYQVAKFNSQTCVDLLNSLDIDLFAIASAPILKEYVFSKAKKGCLNAHPGWLPKYRGLGANAYALERGDLPGISIHFIDAGIDTGKIILREKIDVLRKDTVAKINDRAVVRGAELMGQAILEIEADKLVFQKINEPMGEMYYAMPFSSVKKMNKKLRDKKFINTLH